MPIYKKWPSLSPHAVSYAIDKYLREQQGQRQNLRVDHLRHGEIYHKWGLEYVSDGVATSGMGVICIDPLHPEKLSSHMEGTVYSYGPHGYSAETISDYPEELMRMVAGGAAFVELVDKQGHLDHMAEVLDKDDSVNWIEDVLTKAYLDYERDQEARTEETPLGAGV